MNIMQKTLERKSCQENIDQEKKIPLTKIVPDHYYMLEGHLPMLWKQPFNQ